MGLWLPLQPTSASRTRHRVCILWLLWTLSWTEVDHHPLSVSHTMAGNGEPTMGRLWVVSSIWVSFGTSPSSWPQFCSSCDHPKCWQSSGPTSFVDWSDWWILIGSQFENRHCCITHTQWIWSDACHSQWPEHYLLSNNFEAWECHLAATSTITCSRWTILAYPSWKSWRDHFILAKLYWYPWPPTSHLLWRKPSLFPCPRPLV